MSRMLTKFSLMYSRKFMKDLNIAKNAILRKILFYKKKKKKKIFNGEMSLYIIF